MDRFLSIELIQQLKLHTNILYNVIWQNNADRKHRSHYALDKINEIFQKCIESDKYGLKHG